MRQKLDERSQPQKAHLHPQGMCACNMKEIQNESPNVFPKYAPQTKMQTVLTEADFVFPH